MGKKQKKEGKGVVVANGTATGADTKLEKNGVTSNGKLPSKDDVQTDTQQEVKAPALPPVPYMSLFRMSSAFDKLLIFIGILSAMIAAGSFPLMIILFGDATDAMTVIDMNTTAAIEDYIEAYNLSYTNLTREEFCEMAETGDFFWESSFLENLCKDRDDLFVIVYRYGWSTALIGAAQLILSYLFVSTLNRSAEKQVFRIRNAFVRGILRQDIGWYDTHQTGDFASRVTEDLNKLQEGIGEKLGMFVYFMTIFVSSLTTALIYGWELTLVILSVMPFLVLAFAIIAKVMSGFASQELGAYGKAGAVATEVLSSIRTVMAFRGQDKEIERYTANLKEARRMGYRRSLVTGFGAGLTWFTIFISYSLAFWYGTKLIIASREPDGPGYDPATLIIVFFSVLMGAMNVGQAVPYWEAFTTARGAAALVFEVINRIPPIDSFSNAGRKPETCRGEITFQDVHFNYPSRPDVPVLQGLSLSVKQGQKVAFVGSSGCGKSTCIHLIQRFYDPTSGGVLVDGENIQNLNVGWLRDQIGIVGQEPVLFAMSIEENIRYGRDGVSKQEIIDAAKEANAHDFIMKLPKQYDTLVGERGAQMSGGQKQRIAIARALVRNPRILLLDEATSALDTQSERIVQDALDKAGEGRTTLIVAHRLSTIRQADKIFVLSGGILVESGTDEELMKRKGQYFHLMEAQNKAGEDGGHEEKKGDSHGQGSKVSQEDSALPVLDTSLKLDESLSKAAGVAFSRRAHLRDSMREAKVAESIEKQDEKLKPPPITRIMRENAPECNIMFIGFVASVLMGASMPLYAILFGEVIGVLSNPDNDEAMKDARYYAFLFIGAGVGAGIAAFLQASMFGIAGEQLTLRMRRKTFAAMLRQEISWYDRDENNTGTLTSRLSGDAASMQGASGSRVGTVTQALTTLTMAFSLALYYSWRLGLVTTSFVPLILLSSYIEAKIIFGKNVLATNKIAEANKVVIEAITNIRTVAGLRKEKKFHDIYATQMVQPHQLTLKKSHVRGILFGFAQSLIFFAYAACMYYGGTLMEDEIMLAKDVFKVAEALILGTMMVGQAIAFAPNYNMAMVASARIFNLLDRVPEIDAYSEEGDTVASVRGDVCFRGVHFHYPTRPTAKILNGLNLDVVHGRTVALVGESGCGKSTCIALLERFYDPTAGEVRLDEAPLPSLKVASLRKAFSLVSQEPVLFDRTIAENIAYGDNSRPSIPMAEIITAARKANIHDFISKLPHGYETSVGSMGSQLSGGEKQRVAIARALISNPEILLLDEATSALDATSEKVVQQALDAAQEGRTCLVIAHRLSTIVNADVIFVFRGGHVVESGTHQELIKLQGVYYHLYNRAKLQA